MGIKGKEGKFKRIMHFIGRAVEDFPDTEREELLDTLRVATGKAIGLKKKFKRQPQDIDGQDFHVFTVTMRVPQGELANDAQREWAASRPEVDVATERMAQLLQEDLYDEQGMSGDFVVEDHRGPRIIPEVEKAVECPNCGSDEVERKELPIASQRPIWRCGMCEMRWSFPNPQY